MLAQAHPHVNAPPTPGRRTVPSRRSARRRAGAPRPLVCHVASPVAVPAHPGAWRGMSPGRRTPGLGCRGAVPRRAGPCGAAAPGGPPVPCGAVAPRCRGALSAHADRRVPDESDEGPPGPWVAAPWVAAKMTLAGGPRSPLARNPPDAVGTDPGKPVAPVARDAPHTPPSHLPPTSPGADVRPGSSGAPVTARWAAPRRGRRRALVTARALPIAVAVLPAPRGKRDSHVGRGLSPFT